MNLSRIQQQNASESIRVSAEKTRLSGPWLLVARTVWVTLVVLSLGLTMISFPVYYQQLQRACVDVTTCNIAGAMTAKGLQALAAIGFSASGYAAYNTIFWAVILAIWSGLGFLIFWRRSNDGMALLASFFLVLFNTGPTLPALTITYPALALPIVLVSLIGQVPLWLFFLLFPNGRLVPRWIGLIIPLYILQSILFVASSTSLFDANNWPQWIHALLALSTDGGIIFSQIYRYRRISTAVERQQTKWVAFAIITVVSGFLVFAVLFNVFFPVVQQSDSPYSLIQMVYPLLLLLLPVSVSIAVLRYRLWDIDLIIKRTLVYGILTACVVGIYILVVGYLGTLFHTRSNLAISLLATGLVAVLFQPLRELLQRNVNRLFYGQRDEPYRVISRLGQRLEATLAPDATLSAIVETVAQALKLPHAAIALKRNEEFAIAASYVAPPVRASARQASSTHSETILHLPLLYQSEQVGELLLTPRARDESFTPADFRLLDDLVRQVGVATYAIRLTSDLQQSRERLVTTREEERRRLRRDLHDGLGPTLASITLKLDAARNLLIRDVLAADALLIDLKKQMQGAVADIRHLVYELRPPSLDELGLIPALREQAEQYIQNGLNITIDAPESLPPLPAAVEVATYRIVQEAMTNVVRHAQAHTCTVRIILDHWLDVEIDDDGRGIPEGHRAGVGLASIRERTAELGGTCELESLSGEGTRVHVRLPLSRVTEQEE